MRSGEVGRPVMQPLHERAECALAASERKGKDDLVWWRVVQKVRGTASGYKKSRRRSAETTRARLA